MAQQDALDAAQDSGDEAELARLLQRQPGDAQELFERAIRLAGSEGGSSGGAGATAASGTGLANAGSSMEDGSSGTRNGAAAVVPAASAAAGIDGLQPAAAAWDAVHENREQQHAQPPSREPGGPGSASLATTGGATSGESSGWQWYVFSYQAAWLARRAAFLASCADAGITAGSESSGPAGYWEQAVATYTQALEVAGRGGAVLRRYRFAPATGEGQAQRSHCQTRASSACIMSCCYCTSMALSARLRALLTVSRTAPPSQVCSSRHAPPAASRRHCHSSSQADPPPPSCSPCRRSAAQGC